MTRARSMAGAVVLCALALCAFGASGASAKGLTAFTCTEATGSVQYEDAHCEKEKVGGKFTTEVIPLNTTTEVTGTAEGSSVLVATIALLRVEVVCKQMMTKSGDLKNILVGEEMKVEGANAVLDYTECEAFVGATKKVCKIESITGEGGKAGTIGTNPLTSITSFNATEHLVTFSPAAGFGEVFTEFKLLAGGECPEAAVGIKKVTGAATGVVSTTKHSHITFSGVAGGKLVFGGQKAEYSGTNHLTMEPGEHTIGLKTV